MFSITKYFAKSEDGCESIHSVWRERSQCKEVVITASKDAAIETAGEMAAAVTKKMEYATAGDDDAVIAVVTDGEGVVVGASYAYSYRTSVRRGVVQCFFCDDNRFVASIEAALEKWSRRP